MLSYVGRGLYGAAASVANTIIVTPSKKLLANTLFASSEILINLKHILELLEKDPERNVRATREALHTILTTPAQKAQIEADLKKCSKAELKTEVEIRLLLQLLSDIDAITSSDLTNDINGGDIANLTAHLRNCLEKLNKNLQYNQGAIGQALADAEERLGRLIVNFSTDFKETLRGHPEKIVELHQLLEKIADLKTRNDQVARDRLHAILTNPERDELEAALNLCPDLTCQGEIAALLAAADQVDAISGVNTANTIPDGQHLALAGRLTTTLEFLNRNMRYNIGLAGQHLQQAEDRIKKTLDDVVQKAITGATTEMGKVLAIAIRNPPDRLVELKKLLEDLKVVANRDAARMDRLQVLLTTENAAFLADLTLCTDPLCRPEIIEINSLAGQVNTIIRSGGDVGAIQRRLEKCLNLLAKNMHANQGAAGKLVEDFQGIVGTELGKALAAASTEVNKIIRVHPDKVVELKKILEDVKDPAKWNDPVILARLEALLTIELAALEDELKLCTDNLLHPEIHTIVTYAGTINHILKGTHGATTAASINNRLAPCLKLLEKNMHKNQGAAVKLVEDMQAIVAGALKKVTEEVNGVLRARPERLVEIQSLLDKLKVPATCTKENRDRFNVLIATERALLEQDLKLCEDAAQKTPAAIGEVIKALTNVNAITSVNTGVALGQAQVAAVTARIETALQKLNTNLRSNQGTAGKLLVQAEDRIEGAVDRVIKDAVSQVKDLIRSYPEKLVELTKVLEQLADPATRNDRLNREKLHALLTTPAEKDAIIAALRNCSKAEYHGEIHTILHFLQMIDAITYADVANPIADVNQLNALLKLCSELLHKNLRYNQGEAGQLIEEAVERAITQASAELKSAFKPCPEKLTLLKQALEKLSDKDTFNDIEARTQLHTLISAERALVEEALKQTSDPACRTIGEIGSIMQWLVLIDNITGSDLTTNIDNWQLANIQFLAGQCLPKLKKNILNNQGVVGQLLTQVEDRVEAIANRLIQQVNNKAEDLLRGHPEQLVALKEVLEKIAKPETRDDLATRAKLRTLLTTQRAQVIEALNLCKTDACKAEIPALMVNLDQINAAGAPIAAMFVAVFEGNVKSTLELLKKNLQWNQGSFQMAASGMISRFEEAVAPFTKLADELKPFAREIPELAKQLAQLIATVNLLAERVGLAAKPATPAAPVVLAAGAAAPLSWISWTWISSLLSQVSQKLGGAVSDAAFNATLSFIMYTLKNAERHFENNPQTQVVHGQIKNVISAIDSVLNAGPGHDQGMKWAHAKNAIDTLIGQINGARIYFNGIVGIPAFPMPFGNHPAILNELKQILDLLADPVHQHDQTTRNQLTLILTTRGDELGWALNNCSNPACKADVPIILQQLLSIYNITAFNVTAPIAAGTLPQLTTLVNGCREKLHRNLETNSLKDPTEANILPPIDAFALSSPHWNPPAPASPPRETADVQKSIEDQICKLATHSSEFAYLKFINESICSGKLTTDYFLMIQQAKALAPTYNNNQAEALKQILFTQIENSDLWFFSKWIAKLTYYVMKPLTTHLIGDFSQKLTTTLKQTLDSFEKDNFTKAQNQIVDGLSGYFSALSSAYSRVAAKPFIANTLEKELLAELQDAKLNGNYTPHDLYNKVVHKALSEFNPRAGWTDWVYQSLGLTKKDETQLVNPADNMNPVARAGLNLLAGIASIFLFIPEKIVDFTIYRTVKSVIVKNQILDRVLDESLASLETPSGHTHAVNVIILNLLKKVWAQLLKEDSNGTSPSTDSSSLMVSDERKQKLRGLIENLFQVLAKSKHTTVQSLQEFLTSSSVTGAFTKNLDDLVGNNVVEPTIDILIQTFQQIMNSSQWLELAEQALQGINESFETPATASEAEMIATQNEIAEYLRRVLHKAVGKAVDQKFDIDKKFQEREMDKCLSQLKGSTKTFRDLIYGEFTNGQRAYIGEMIRPIPLALSPAYGQPQHDHAQAWFTAVQDASAGYFQFAALEQATANFLNERLSESTKYVYNNPMLDEKSKNELGAYYSLLIQKFNGSGPYKAYIQYAKAIQHDLYHWIQNYNAFSPAFGASLMLQDFIQESMQTPGVIDQARSALPTIIDGLNQQGISFDMTALKFQLDRMHDIKKVNLAVVEEVSDLFDDFVKEKEGLLHNKFFGLFNVFSSLQEKRDVLEAKLLELLPDSLGPDATHIRGVILAQIKSIATSKDPNIVAGNAGYCRQLIGDYKSNWTAAFNQIHNLAKDQVAELSRRIQVRVLEQRAQIQRLKGERDVQLNNAKKQLQAILTDIEKFEKKPIVDVQIMQSLVKPLLSGIKSLTINRVQDKAEGCIRLVRNPANYRYGLFHRLVFLPYVGEGAPQA